MTNPITILMLLFSMFSATAFAQGFEYEVAFEEAQIQEQIDRVLPISKSSSLIHLEVTSVDVSLLGENDRLQLKTDLKVNVLGDYAGDGQMLLESGIRYDAKAGAFYLVDVRVLELKGEQIPQALVGQLSSLAEQVMNQVWPRYPVYTLDPSEINQHLVKSSLKAVKIRDKKLIAVMEM